MKNIEQRLAEIHQNIDDAEQKSGRAPGSVRLLAVSKTRKTEEILAAARLGQRDFGENYVQEAVDKINFLSKYKLKWHFIGPIQSNKTGPIARYFDWVHSVDRPKIARRLSDARPEESSPLNVCIQVNISREQSKSGISLPELHELTGLITSLPRLKLRGLMTMPALSENVCKQRQAFSELKQAFCQLKNAGFTVDTLSMGTTNDMEAAIAEGATIVRIGTAIFGPRAT